jgi:hypothetical protein
MLVACGTVREGPQLPPRSAAPPVPPENPKIQRESAATSRIEADIAYLASDALSGRGTGERGAALAANFVARRFSEIGLTPLGDAEQGARTYLQRFPAKLRLVVEECFIALEEPRRRSLGAAPTRDRLEVTISDEIVVADGSSNGTASGRPVFVGYGISAPALGWDDYAHVDVKGHVAVVLAGAPDVSASDAWQAAMVDFESLRNKVRTAKERGAAGVVFVNPEGGFISLPRSMLGSSVPAIVIPRALADGIFPRGGFGDASLWQVQRASGPRALGVEGRMTFTTSVRRVDAAAWNVIGLLPARDGALHAAQHVVVGAHYDHLGGEGAGAAGEARVAPGADDNASGTALVIEVARRLARLPRRPDRGVVFVAFGAEELGLLGSRHFVEQPPVPASSMVAMINADMVGRLRRESIFLDGVGSAGEWAGLVRDASRDLGLRAELHKADAIASDHRSFQAARIPFLYLFTGHHEDYHRASDTADRVNVDGVERLATFAARLSLSAAQAREAFAFRDPSAGERSANAGELGMAPDLSFAGKGVRLADARRGSPSAIAGAAPGDVVIRLGPRAVGDMHDYAAALRALEGEREIEIEVLRDRARVVLKVVVPRRS